MKLTRLIIRLVFSLLLAAAPILADDAGVESPFSVGVGARQLGLGGGFTSMADDATALFYNPAGLSRLPQQEFTFMHMSLFEGTVYDWGAWSTPIEKVGGVGLAFMRIGSDDVYEYENFVRKDKLHYSMTQVVLGFGRELFSRGSVGANLKVVNQALDSLSDFGFGFDLGFTADLGRDYSFGLMLRDAIPAELQLNGASEKPPLTIVAGLSRRNLVLAERSSLSANLDFEKTEHRQMKIHSGLELLIDSIYALRGGFDRDNIAFGAGLKIRNMKIDYAYKVLANIENSHRFSITFLLGESVAERHRKQALSEQQRGVRLIADERQKMFSFHMDKGDEYFARGQFDSALTAYHQALAFDETNPDVLAAIARTEQALMQERAEREKRQLAELERTISVETFLNQAREFNTKKLYPAALDLLQLVFDVEPENREALELKKQIEAAMATEIAAGLSRVREAERQGRWAEAIEICVRILELDPDNAELQAAKRRAIANLDKAQMLSLAVELFGREQYQQARKLFEAVIDRDPDNPVALEYLRKIDQAIGLTPSLEELQQNKAIWQLYLDGLRQVRSGEYTGAIATWEKVLEVFPKNENTLSNMEQARLRLESERSE